MIDNLMRPIVSEKSVKRLTKLASNKAFMGIATNVFFNLYKAYSFARKIELKNSKRDPNSNNINDYPPGVWRDVMDLSGAIAVSLRRSIKRGIVSPRVIERLGKNFTLTLSERKKIRNELEKKHDSVPAFAMISPSNICNLKCIGCYAGENYDKHTLKFEVFDWIINNMKTKLGTRFFVISGGEPFAYNDNGKTILDIFAKHQDCFFLVFTNSTLITKEVAARLEKVGNVTPAISVEGFKEETEARRGPGVFEKILGAMKNLREKGIPFGISVTPMKHNANLLLSDDFVKFWFDKQGATYAWYFQYMPIGRNPNADLLVTPEQRKRMWEKTWHHIRKGYFIADFWNCGSISRGCLSSARNGGYFHILWNGDVTPCGFVPYKDKNKTLNNVYALKKNGKDILDAINAPLFKEIREFQKRQQNHAKGKKCRGGCSGVGCGNLLMPCPIRDNSREFQKIIKKVKAIPFDEGAVQYLDLIKKGIMPSYNDACHNTMDEVWKYHYIKGQKLD